MHLLTFQMLADELLKEEKLLRSRLVPNVLKSLYDKGLAKVRVRREEIISFVALWPTKQRSWYELGTLWVHPDDRKKNISSQVFTECLDDNKEKNIFLITRSIKVVHLARVHEMEESTAWHTDPFWVKLCEPWDELPSQGTRVLPKEGRLFYRKV